MFDKYEYLSKAQVRRSHPSHFIIYGHMSHHTLQMSYMVSQAIELVALSNFFRVETLQVSAAAPWPWI